MEKKFLTENGITHFSRKTERIIFFVLTIGMLLWLGVEKVSDLIK